VRVGAHTQNVIHDLVTQMGHVSVIPCDMIATCMLARKKGVVGVGMLRS
jgi:hypothetical protein